MLPPSASEVTNSAVMIEGTFGGWYGRGRWF